MKEPSRRMAFCGIMAALGVVIMLLGSVLGLGMYLAPMLVGLCLVPIGRAYGKKYQLLLWIATSLLCMMLVPNVEQNLMLLCLFGWYPALRPALQKLPFMLRLGLKAALFNAIIIPLELLIMLVLVPEPTGAVFAVLLLILGNVTFLCYDFAIPAFEFIINKYLKKIFPPH